MKSQFWCNPEYYRDTQYTTPRARPTPQLLKYAAHVKSSPAPPWSPRVMHNNKSSPPLTQGCPVSTASSLSQSPHGTNPMLWIKRFFAPNLTLQVGFLQRGGINYPLKPPESLGSTGQPRLLADREAEEPRGPQLTRIQSDPTLFSKNSKMFITGSDWPSR